MTVNDYVRTPVTDEILAGQIEILSRAFPNTDNFYSLLLEILRPMKLTESELKTAIRDVIKHHSGNLYIADVVKECDYRRLEGIRKENDAIFDRRVEQWKKDFYAENADFSREKREGGINTRPTGKSGSNEPKSGNTGIL